MALRDALVVGVLLPDLDLLGVFVVVRVADAERLTDLLGVLLGLLLLLLLTLGVADTLAVELRDLDAVLEGEGNEPVMRSHRGLLPSSLMSESTSRPSLSTKPTSRREPNWSPSLRGCEQEVCIRTV